jgi:hypothetical protein
MGFLAWLPGMPVLLGRFVFIIGKLARFVFWRGQTEQATDGHNGVRCLIFRKDVVYGGEREG